MSETAQVKRSLGDRWYTLSMDGKIGAIAGFLIVVAILYKIVFALVVHQPLSAPQDELVSWQKYVQKNPADPAGYVGLGSTYQMMGDLGDAKTNIDKALKMAPKNLAALYAIAKWYEAQNDDKLAIQYLIKVGDASQPFQKYVAYFDAGMIYQNDKKYLEAIPLYKEALASNATMADIHIALGQCYEATHQPKLALQEYRYALQFNTQDTALAQKIAKLSKQIGAGN